MVARADSTAFTPGTEEPGTTPNSTASTQGASSAYQPTADDRRSYPWRFGSLAMAARLFLEGLMTRPEFIREVNAAHADAPAFPPIPEDKPCYCENRECNCTPEIVQRIETIFTPDPVPADEDWPVMPFVTPLTYSDSLTLVDGVLAHDFNRVLLRDRLAHLLMTVDCESRKQGYVVTGGEEPVR